MVREVLDAANLTDEQRADVFGGLERLAGEAMPPSMPPRRPADTPDKPWFSAVTCRYVWRVRRDSNPQPSDP